MAALSVILPIFGLILTGFLCRRFGVLGPHAAGELNRFVVWLALPALLFGVMANARAGDLDRPGFAAAFGLGSFGIFGATLIWRRLRGQSLAAASINGLNAGYANAGFIGLPLCLAAFGPGSLPEATIATILTVSALFALAVVLIEAGRGGSGGVVRQLLALIRNPLLLAPVLGLAYGAAAPALPGPVEQFLTLLGGASTPCALVSLGLFIGERRPHRDAPLLSALVLLKLVGQPVLTWLLASLVFALTAREVAIAVVLAALPTGTGSFMLAEFHGCEAEITARAILVSTVLSVASVAVLLAVLG